MAPSKKTWIWILVALLGLGVVFVIAVAGFGFYFVANYVKAGQTSSAEAFKALDEARAAFKDAPPLFELDKYEDPRLTRRLEDMPTATRKADMLHILVWDPDRERLVRVTMPFWMLRLGRQKIDISSGAFDLQRLQLDVQELERVGSILLFDYRPPGGQRVLVWTQ